MPKAFHTVLKQGRGDTGIRKLMLGILISAVILCCAVSICAFVISRGSLSIKRAGTVGKLIYAAVVAAGAFYASRQQAAGKLLWALLTGVSVCLLTSGVLLLIPGEADFSFYRLVLISIVFALIGGLFAVRKKGSGYI